MNTINPLKRPLTVPNDPLKLLVCKICKKDNVVLNLKTCGCLFCDSCDGDSRYKCISCNSELDQKIKLSFTKNPRCKYYEHNKCYNSAEYKCRCLPNCFVCSSCLNYIHRKKVRGSCVPEMLTVGITTNDELCQLCKEFYAGFRMTSRPYSKICLDCKTNSNAACASIEETSDTEVDWNQFYKDFEQFSQNVPNKIKKIEDELESSSLAREQEIEKCKDAISEIQKCLDKYTIQCDVHILLLNKQLDDFKKISDILKPDGKVKTILDLLKNKQLTLHGEPGKEQMINLLNYYQEKNSYNPRCPVTEKIKTFIVQNNSSRQHLLKFPYPTTCNTPISDVSFQEIVDNGVKPFVILVEIPSKVNKRKKILEDIEKHQDKWVRKESFDHGEIVIIFDADALAGPKYKRAKILERGDDSSEVFLLDFGFEITVENSSIGKIKEIKIDGQKTCFLVQLTGSVDLQATTQKDLISKIFRFQNEYPKAKHLHVVD
ncbi:uncharacterized protein LOC107360680 isoform X1 [Tetranychus urticae]|uniref:uncharacterized protein LOC107360680 isoform X1 n=1 Tax=Tetranychus urticae TaxID=32264 RepID=UPI000D6462B9|nr:uncharacterized protein LOC107360680 isoform X1 [Tetranychus urticae]